ncbi:unnamed protein product [Clonostachys byssicola]|uniref:Tyrosinase copper-binding domain-containing protein n=1 Tax=Clonostachys byssicola TaxID=160290 RepID=A0A9N9XZG9_9HYPO|nr:unnamed protein product [Clonostachys byssicola]
MYKIIPFLFSPLLASAWTPASTEGSDYLAAESLEILTNVVNNGSLAEHLVTLGVSQTCNISKAVVRREYSNLSDDEKLEYTAAVQCLMSLPAKVSPHLVPGAKSRYDDFVATHINQTDFIHQNGPFLFWHRLFMWTFEQTLRDECGYTGYLPYWNYGKSAEDILNSPYFDGSETSQGGNGVYQEHNDTVITPLVTIPSETGGGCITGPYANNMANISATEPFFSGVKTGELFAYEPRCIRRDISTNLAQSWATDNYTVDQLTNPDFQTDFGAFQNQLDNVGSNTNGRWPLHLYGHYAMNGDPGGDFYNSPNEPMFWLNHANIDRLWWIWQNQKPIDRAFMINGTMTTGNEPPSADATMEDIIDMGDYVGGSSAIKHHVSTVAGQYCYIYL